MKAFLGLGVLCLLGCLTWADERVTVECNLLMFRVLVNKNLFADGVLVRAEELTLGLGCPVTRQLVDKFELHYSVTECGIEFQAFETHVIYRSLLHYFPLYPVFGRYPTHFTVSCQVPRQLGSKSPAKSDVLVPSMEKKRTSALRMFPGLGPTFWTPELHQTLERKGSEPFLKEEVESRNWVSLPILTLSSVVCHLLYRGDIGLSAP